MNTWTNLVLSIISFLYLRSFKALFFCSSFPARLSGFLPLALYLDHLHAAVLLNWEQVLLLAVDDALSGRTGVLADSRGQRGTWREFGQSYWCVYQYVSVFVFVCMCVFVCVLARWRSSHRLHSIIRPPSLCPYGTVGPCSHITQLLGRSQQNRVVQFCVCFCAHSKESGQFIGAI